MTTTMRRWDGDMRGEGIADGGWIAEDVREFLATLDAPKWIAEEPENHLLPNLQRACADASSPWTLQGAVLVDGLYIVSLDWAGRPPGIGRLRADLFALLGGIAESATYVHQRVRDDVICYDVATGMLADTMHFHPHGHLVQFRVGGPAVSAICAARRVPPSSGVA